MGNHPTLAATLAVEHQAHVTKGESPMFQIRRIVAGPATPTRSRVLISKERYVVFSDGSFRHERQKVRGKRARRLEKRLRRVHG
jgi:hypothetical protein